MTRVPIRYSPGKGFALRLVGVLQRAAYVEVGDPLVRVRMGWAFHAAFNRDRIASVEHAPDVALTAGAHGWNGRWLVNGASGPIVTIRLHDHVRAWVAGFPVRLREVSVSVTDPEALISALSLG
jgi:hypothetical protein